MLQVDQINSSNNLNFGCKCIKARKVAPKVQSICGNKIKNDGPINNFIFNLIVKIMRPISLYKMVSSSEKSVKVYNGKPLSSDLWDILQTTPELLRARMKNLEECYKRVAKK